MKLITVDLPDSYLKAIEKSSICVGINRPEHLRLEIRSQLIQELNFENEFEDKNNPEFFDYCINCERKLDNESRKSHLFHNNIEVFLLRFCCACYRQFKDTSFDDFPAHIIDNILKEIDEYKKNRGLI